MKYREFLSLTDAEISFILMDIFNPTKIENIRRDEKYNEITVDITTGGWDDGEGGTFQVTDEMCLQMDTIEVDFSLDKTDLKKWRQFLLAKGCDVRLKDNPYLVS